MCVQEKKDQKSPQCVILYIQIQVQVGAILSRIQGSSGQVSGGEAPAPANILDLLRGDTRS